MRTLVRLAALAAALWSFASFSSPKATVEELPLSCLPAAKPFFARAWESFSNVHLDDARQLFNQTLAVDPSCTLAWAYLGSLTPGAQGRGHLDQAVEGSGAVSEVERLLVQSLLAQHKGDLEQALTLARKARDLSPNVYELNFIVAQRAGVMQLWSDAQAAAQRATELAPQRGAGWNVLGYAYVFLKQHPQAVKAFQRYAEAVPMEPNAHDSLGDALLANNQLDEARAAYQRALDTSGGSFWVSGHGMATVYALQGDWFGARAAIERARRSAPQLDDRLRLMQWTAWSYLADDKPTEAYAALEEAEADARRGKLEARVAESIILKGRFQLAQGKYPDALKTFGTLAKARYPTLNEGQRLAIDAARLHGIAESQARLGRIADAEKTLGQMRVLFDFRPRDQQGLDAVAHTRGLIALQKKDPALAISAFMQCSELFDACRLDLATAQEAAGDTAEAVRTRTALARTNHRDPEYWWVRVKALAANNGAKPKTVTQERPSY